VKQDDNHEEDDMVELTPEEFHALFEKVPFKAI
jgi:hypothetical protein